VLFLYMYVTAGQVRQFPRGSVKAIGGSGKAVWESGEAFWGSG